MARNRRPKAERELMDVLRRLAERSRTVHERVECPRCSAPVGEVCRAMPKGYVGSTAGNGRRLRDSHEARRRADGIVPR